MVRQVPAQRGVVEHGSPAGIDEQAARMQAGKRPGIEEVEAGPGLLQGQFRMQGDYVTAQQLIPAGGLRQAVLVQPGVVNPVANTQALKPGGHRPADMAVTDDTHAAPGKQFLQVFAHRGDGRQHILHHRIGIGSRCMAETYALAL